MRRIWVIITLAILLGSCSVFPGDFFGGWTEQGPTLVCPTCPPTQVCPELPTSTIQPPTETDVPSPTGSPEPTATMTWTDTPVPTVTSTLTATLVPTNTPLPVIPSPTLLAYPLGLQTGTPVYTQNFARPNEGCNWMGIGGQVFDLNGLPLKNYVVVVTGKFGGKVIDLVSLTGLSPSYGPGGYEVTLGNTLLKEEGIYLVVYNLAGEVQSNTIQLQTQPDCKKNLIVVNFIKN